MDVIRAAAVQFEHVAGDKAANLETVRRFVDHAVELRVQVVAFPECCLTGYWFLRHLSPAELAELAEPVPDGPTCRAVRELAAESGVTVGAGLVERGNDGRLYNSYLVALPDGACHRHRKLHCFVSQHMASGEAYTVFDTPYGWRVGVLICYDCNIGENVRMTALRGCDLLLAPHQTGGCKSINPHVMGLVDRGLWDRREEDPASIEAELRGPKGRGWLMRWLPSRAHDNGLFLIFSNGVGTDDDEIRTGNSAIFDPYGRVMAETAHPGDDMVVADLDPRLLENCTGRRWNRSRRPELYGDLARPTGQERDTRELLMVDKGIRPAAPGD